MKFFNSFLTISAVFVLTGCSSLNNGLHPFIYRLQSVGIELDMQTSAGQGINSYAVSPEFRALAVATGKTGNIFAWGKA